MKVLGWQFCLPALATMVLAAPLQADPVRLVTLSLPQASAHTVPAGTPVVLTLNQSIKSGAAKAGDTVTYKVAREVDDGQIILIPMGTPAYGKVTTSHGAGAFGTPGKLQITCDYVQLTDGTHIPLHAAGSISRQGGSNEGAAATTGIVLGGVTYVASDFSRNFFSSNPDHTTPVLAGLAVGIVTSALWQGRNTALDAGTEFDVTVAQDTVLPQP